MDADDVAQIAESLRQALSGRRDDPERILAEFGWNELLADEPAVAVSTTCGLFGELLAAGSVVDAVMIAASGIDLPDGTRVVLPVPGRATVPGRRTGPGTVAVDGTVRPGGVGVLIATLGDERFEFVVAATLDHDAGDPLDPTVGWRRTAGDVVASPVSASDPELGWARMVAAGRRALAHELIGVASRMLSMTVEHVTDRHQFNQPLGSFQAVKHQLADVHLWQQAAILTAAAAWEDQGAPSAALAKASAVRFSRTARATCQQLLGGMGFTWEHDFHRYLRRALTLEPLLGNASALHRELGAALRAGDVDGTLIAL
ncbi:acyl-CoA dehydrogenase family protein [Mycolicibacterium neoaurum]|uniref:acyl-CoA dehydrogenase family protein n=1 Tax=Mycolicibacterium neoaurum TaxID=1795 RepID=UPI00267209C4|nr:acyl-CoA dehydrogenase family protein [Mycolicibacterium neoaurum]MDO3402748.1 acyl-CoA dehydrogenase family protein [Mycolicibacterium neoaurum]